MPQLLKVPNCHILIVLLIRGYIMGAESRPPELLSPPAQSPLLVHGGTLVTAERMISADVLIAEGSDPEVIKQIFQGEMTGTLFVSESTIKKTSSE